MMTRNEIMFSVTVDGDRVELDVIIEELMKQLLQKLAELGANPEEERWIPCG